MVVYDPTWLLTGVLSANLCFFCCLSGYCADALDEIFGKERMGCGGILGHYKILVDRPVKEACDERNG